MSWFETHQTVIHPWMCDRFGHLNVRFYAHILDDAAFALWPLCGVTLALFEQLGLHTVVAHTATDFKAELVPGQVVAVRSRFERLGTKSVSYAQELRDIETDRVHATQVAVEVFFDPATRDSRDIPATVRELLEPLVVS